MINAVKEERKQVVVDEPMSGSETWTYLEVPAGQYKLTLSASVKTQKVSSSAVVFVKPAETAKIELSLPGALHPTAAPPPGG